MRLRGKDIALVTNHTGRDHDRPRAPSTCSHQADGVKLVALFSPEHGIRGAVDEDVTDSKDEKTGLPVYSLYGPRRKPTAELLKGIDTLVYDIQDVGCRFYTYISTLGLTPGSRGREQDQGDRPRSAQPDRRRRGRRPGARTTRMESSFVAWHTLPLRHGLTVGELARLFNDERHIGVDLEVVEVRGLASRPTSTTGPACPGSTRRRTCGR